MSLQQILHVLFTIFVGVKVTDAQHAANVVATSTDQVITPLVNIISNTPLELTVTNPIVVHVWMLMVAVADTLLGLFVVLGTLQIMYGQQTGTLSLPLGQFLSRAILTAILIHLSALIGRELLLLNNQLCDIVGASVPAFIRSVNGGQLLAPFTQGIVNDVMIVVFNIGFLRLFFQAIKRIIRFNVFHTLSGLALLTAFHPATVPVFSIWVRMYVSTIFEQFLQVLTFDLGYQFLIASKQTGLLGFLLAIAMLHMTTEIPSLLTRFGAAVTGGTSSLNIGSIVKAALAVAMFFG